MKQLTWLTATILALTLTTACGSDDDKGAREISSAALTGTVAGAPFEVRSGSATLPFEDGEYWIELSSDEVEDPCNVFSGGGTGPSILLRSDGSPSDAPLGLSNNITFTYTSDGEIQNDVATVGRLVIDGIADGELRGGLYATMRDHVVDGQFSVPVCD